MKKLLILVVIIVLALLIWWGLSSDTTEAPEIGDQETADVVEDADAVTDLEGLDDASLEAEFEEIDADLESL